MKFIFWDWNGTLVDDAPALWQAFNELATSRGGCTVSFERYREMYRHPVRDMYAEVGVDLKHHSFEAIAAEWHHLYSSLSGASQLQHDALGTLSALRERGSRQMVVSALPHDFLGVQVDRFGVRHFFEHVRGIPDELAHSKVGQAQSLAEALRAQGEDITVIGDSSHDAEVARELGAVCYLVARGAESRKRLESHGYPVFDDFSQIVRSI
jgi:phosphoglycolate phosphatase